MSYMYALGRPNFLPTKKLPSPGVFGWLFVVSLNFAQGVGRVWGDFAFSSRFRLASGVGLNFLAVAIILRALFLVLHLVLVPFRATYSGHIFKLTTF